MKSNIFIPKRINVGYQERMDTFTGRLAYIIYYDEKGKLRKETSWNNWRDKEIQPDEFKNVPTSGFVLNKKVGDKGCGWNHRHAYCRVFDPRGFEFEITFENLMYILDYVNCLKGKGLDGEFVYGWDGKDLVLIPVVSPDYREITSYNTMIQTDTGIKTKDLIVGASYLTSDNDTWIYMGAHGYYTEGYLWFTDGVPTRCVKEHDIPDDISHKYEYCIIIPRGRYHWFKTNSGRGESFIQYRTLPRNKLVRCIDSNRISNFNEILSVMEAVDYYSPYDYTKDVIQEMTLDEFKSTGSYFISSYEGVDKSYLIDRCYKGEGHKYRVLAYSGTYKSRLYSYYLKEYKTLALYADSLEEIFDKMKPKRRQMYKENGKVLQTRYTLRYE